MRELKDGDVIETYEQHFRRFLHQRALDSRYRTNP
jgi:hypothetical protein